MKQPSALYKKVKHHITMCFQGLQSHDISMVGKRPFTRVLLSDYIMISPEYHNDYADTSSTRHTRTRVPPTPPPPDTSRLTYFPNFHPPVGASVARHGTCGPCVRVSDTRTTRSIYVCPALSVLGHGSDMRYLISDIVVTHLFDLPNLWKTLACKCFQWAQEAWVPNTIT